MIDVGVIVTVILLWPVWLASQAQPHVGTLGAWLIGVPLWCAYYLGLGWGYATLADE